MSTHGHPGWLHQGQPIKLRGRQESPRAAMVLLHGRGDSAEGILGLVDHLEQPGWVYLAPQAHNHAWYPQRFVAPITQNEPWLSSALQAVQDTLESTQQMGVPLERTMLLGFSQGACLALEFAARNGAARLAAVVALSGGLIGETLTPDRYRALAGLHVLMGCSDVDAHIPKVRVQESAVLLEALGARVDLRIYQNFGHSINQDEIGATQALMAGL